MSITHILIADDSAQVRDLVGEYLQGLGYRVQTAADGERAVALIRAQPFDLVITDLQMPRVDGLGVLHAAKAQDPDMEVVILTGYPTLESAIGALREGAHDYMLKPVENLDILRHVVESALSHRSLVLENHRLVHELQKLNADLTDRVAQQTQQLQQAYEQLKDLEQMKARFVSVTSHELRTPLAQLFLTTDVLRGRLDENSIQGAKACLTELASQSQRLKRLVDNLLDFSQMDRDEFELELGPCHLPALVRATVELWRARVEEKGLGLQISMPEQDILLTADTARLQHALGQLLDNAVKFTPEGGRIVVGVHEPVRPPWQEASPSLYVVIAVADSGVGIPAEKQQAIFQAFTQADMSDQRRFGGLGMGLTITSRIVAAHGGRIMLQSEPGQGSTFTIWLPVR